jgi:hypothetical protein
MLPIGNRVSKDKQSLALAVDRLILVEDVAGIQPIPAFVLTFPSDLDLRLAVQRRLPGHTGSRQQLATVEDAVKTLTISANEVDSLLPGAGGFLSNTVTNRTANVERHVLACRNGRQRELSRYVVSGDPIHPAVRIIPERLLVVDDLEETLALVAPERFVDHEELLSAQDNSGGMGSKGYP